MRNWFNNLMPASIDTWGTLMENFLTKYFSPQLTSKFRAEITQVRQGD